MRLLFFNNFIMEWRKVKLSEKALEELNNAEKQIKNPRLIKKIQCIKLKNKQWKHHEISECLDIRIETISVWLKKYFEEGLKALLTWGYKGKISILTLENQEELQKINSEKPFNTAKSAKAYIKEHFQVDLHLHWVQKILKKNFDFRIKKPN